MNSKGLFAKKAWISLAVILAMVSLAACGNKKEEAANSSSPTVTAKEQSSTEKPKDIVKVKVLGSGSWFKDGMAAVQKDALDKLGIELVIEKTPEGADGANLMKTRFATNDKPDILFFAAGVNNQHNFGEPADTFVAQDDQPWMQNFDKDKWKGVMDSPDDKFYSIPYTGSNALGMIYNKKVFASLNLKVPTTLDEFWAVCEALKKAGKIPVYMSGKDGWTLQIIPLMSIATPTLNTFMSQLSENKAKLTDWADQKKGLTIVRDIVTKGYTDKDYLSDTYDNAQKAVATGEAGMYPMGSAWVMPEIAKKYPDQVNDIGAFTLPMDNEGKNLVGMLPPNAMYVVKGKNQEAAQKFANFFASIEEQNVFFAAEGGGVPAIKGVSNPQLTAAEQDLKTVVDQGNYALAVSRTLYAWDTNFVSYVQDVAIGGKTPEQVQAAEQKDVEKAAKNKNDPNFK